MQAKLVRARVCHPVHIGSHACTETSACDVSSTCLAAKSSCMVPCLSSMQPAGCCRPCRHCWRCWPAFSQRLQVASQVVQSLWPTFVVPHAAGSLCCCHSMSQDAQLLLGSLTKSPEISTAQVAAQCTSACSPGRACMPSVNNAHHTGACT